jgi:DNA polymerase zeta
MAPPIRGLDVQYADQRGSEVKKVPVVRIFGSTPAGKSLLIILISE